MPQFKALDIAHKRRKPGDNKRATKRKKRKETRKDGNPILIECWHKICRNLCCAGCSAICVCACELKISNWNCSCEFNKNACIFVWNKKFRPYQRRTRENCVQQTGKKYVPAWISHEMLFLADFAFGRQCNSYIHVNWTPIHHIKNNIIRNFLKMKWVLRK